MLVALACAAQKQIVDNVRGRNGSVHSLALGTGQQIEIVFIGERQREKGQMNIERDERKYCNNWDKIIERCEEDLLLNQLRSSFFPFHHMCHRIRFCFLLLLGGCSEKNVAGWLL